MSLLAFDFLINADNDVLSITGVESILGSKELEPKLKSGFVGSSFVDLKLGTLTRSAARLLKNRLRCDNKSLGY